MPVTESGFGMDSNSRTNFSYGTPIRSDSDSCSSGNTGKRPVYDRTSTNPYKTPVRAKHQMCITRLNSFRKNTLETMPIYSPPNKNFTFIRNPFEEGKMLKDRLSKPMCSPSLFQAITTPKENNNFKWSIEDISVFRPADIDENPCQDFDSWFSPATENEAQEAINKFFSNQTMMVSPIVKEKRIVTDKETISCTKGTQTVLSLPPILPPEVEDVLKVYCMFNTNHDELNVSTGSQSRKKLLFDDITVESETSNDSTSSPPCSNMQVESMRRDASSTPVTHHLASPGWSPIGSNKSVLDTDGQIDSVMSVDASLLSRTTFHMSSNGLSLSPKSLESKDVVAVCSTPRHMQITMDEEDSAFSSM